MQLARVIESFIGTSLALLLVLVFLWFVALPKIRKALNPMAGMFEDA